MDEIDVDQITVAIHEEEGQKIAIIHVPDPADGWSSPGAKLRWLRTFRERMEQLMPEPFEIREE